MCSACSKLEGVFKLAENLSKIFEKKKKNEGKLGTLFTIIIWQINDLMPTYSLLKYIMQSMLARLTPLHSENVN